jgi:hypothetical protein
MQSNEINELIKINEFTYNLKIKGENNKLLYKLIKNRISSSHFDDESQSIFFSAEKVVTLKNYLLEKPISHGKCVKLIDELTNQINELKEIGYGFYGFDMEDILTIDDNFIFVSTKYLQVLEEESFIFYFPIKQSYFTNPEIVKLTILPSKINYKCIFYSLGLLVIFCLLNINLLVNNEIKSEKEIENFIYPLKNTKIYWFLKRCLKEDINERLILLI